MSLLVGYKSIRMRKLLWKTAARLRRRLYRLRHPFGTPRAPGPREGPRDLSSPFPSPAAPVYPLRARRRLERPAAFFENCPPGNMC